MTYCHLLHNRAKIAILPLKAGLILQEELLKIMKKDSVENSPLRMTLTVNPCHGRDEDSKSGPIQRTLVLNQGGFLDIFEARRLI
jgi:hypothetical protein